MGLNREKSRQRTTAHLQDFDFTFDLRQLSRTVDVPFSDQLYGDFFPLLHMEAEFDLTKLALSQGLKQQVRTELGDGAAGVDGSVSYSCRVGVDVVIHWKVVSRNLVWSLRRREVVGCTFSR